jgi:hypothetical protein
MKNSRYLQKAKFVQTLVFYDGPQLILLSAANGHHLLAAAVEKEGYQYPFFACEIRDRLFQKYLDGKVDLHYVFRSSDVSKHYFFDYFKINNSEVSLKRASIDDIKNESYYPSPGFFSRDHTHSVDRQVLVSADKQIFNIDGSWEAQDFSRFYAKISDLYSFIAVTADLGKSANKFDTKRISTFVNRYFWRGGGSYVGFYNDISSEVQSQYPLRVSRIQYASPGQIELIGNSDNFQKLGNVISIFDVNKDSIKESYRKIYAILRKEKLLGEYAESKFSSDAIETQTQKECFSLAEKIGLDNYRQLFDISDNNTLLFCKIVLSFYRRAKDFHQFHEEGRMSPETN